MILIDVKLNIKRTSIKKIFILYLQLYLTLQSIGPNYWLAAHIQTYSLLLTILVRFLININSMYLLPLKVVIVKAPEFDFL